MAKESVFSTPRTENLTASQMLENFINKRNNQRNNLKAIAEAQKASEIDPDFTATLEAASVEADKKARAETAMENAEYKQGAKNIALNKFGLRSQMIQEATDYITGKVLGELIYECYWLDDELKETTADQITDNIENVLGYVEENFPSAKVSERNMNPMTKNIFNAIKETADAAVNRIVKECDEDCTVYPEFNLTDAEEDELDNKLVDLGKDDIIDLVKEKVAAVVQDEKRRGEEKSNLFKEIDELSSEGEEGETEEGETEDGEETDESLLASIKNTTPTTEAVEVPVTKYRYNVNSSSYTANERYMASVIESDQHVQLFNDPTWGEFKAYVSLQCKQIRDVLDRAGVSKNAADYKNSICLIEDLEKRLVGVPETVTSEVKQYIMAMVNIIYASVSTDDVVICRFGNPMGAPDIQSSSPSIDYTTISWMDLFANIKTNLASIKNYCNDKANAEVIDDDTLNDSDCPVTGKDSLAQKVAQAQTRILTKNLGGSLFEAMMIGAIKTISSATMESSSKYNDEDVDNAALVESLLNYTILETLDTIGMYKFRANDINAMMRNFMYPTLENLGDSNNSILGHGKDKKGLKKIRINTKKLKQKKNIMASSISTFKKDK